MAGHDYKVGVACEQIAPMGLKRSKREWPHQTFNFGMFLFTIIKIGYVTEP